ncbi:hypothetical protein H0H81_011009 [Sphagnurus paluster]|uniref:Uncharacterized protein n=1 Tax=Sphagnurus paluster TaxID=117069 RepID=A0A9P7GIR7_9AGAR|nr:hypothetical protein H0H81_011009 [Sphagnurus paluster]
MPWITEAILLLAFHVAIKLARAVINIIYFVQWNRSASISTISPHALTASEMVNVKASWILELLGQY